MIEVETIPSMPSSANAVLADIPKQQPQQQSRKRTLGLFNKRKRKSSLSNGTYIMDPSMIDNSQGCLSVDSSTGEPQQSTRQKQHQQRMPGGCIKYPTQHESATNHYVPPHHGRSVQWGKIVIRSHAIRLGDNPSCWGPPITTQWQHHEEVCVTVDQYEDTRPPYRHKKELIMPTSTREDLLRNAGYSRGEMKEAAERGSLIRVYRNRNSRMTKKEQLSAFLAKIASSKNGANKPISIDKAKRSESISLNKKEASSKLLSKKQKQKTSGDARPKQ
mmetsp:Transcript_23634/g.66765  ORF Transcript_23634/g.66765 Transcript_23634/m.66765 type:complete len:275 (+) Transcript_23634:424-1248(+)|eukprot:CAMPEP_0119550356 /NCGR_PEP_ID=MMETSP1352-20130426/3884_1 /TAXON_ID=265584 /ORGANISM="Stauroneis constricta, Strain CCMP1120" /LENGTH=274 /DNA_ID=CAMNT_0007596175 /DNA_START=152 /DNA_END=976 /DNA_ORIENTATION=+